MQHRRATSASVSFKTVFLEIQNVTLWSVFINPVTNEVIYEAFADFKNKTASVMCSSLPMVKTVLIIIILGIYVAKRHKNVQTKLCNRYSYCTMQKFIWGNFKELNNCRFIKILMNCLQLSIILSDYVKL